LVIPFTPVHCRFECSSRPALVSKILTEAVDHCPVDGVRSPGNRCLSFRDLVPDATRMDVFLWSPTIRGTAIFPRGSLSTLTNPSIVPLGEYRYSRCSCIHAEQTPTFSFPRHFFCRSGSFYSGQACIPTLMPATSRLHGIRMNDCDSLLTSAACPSR